MIRWDWGTQGRQEYFEFDTIRKAARVLISMSGSAVTSSGDQTRAPLTAATGLAFPTGAGGTHSVHRNYGTIWRRLLIGGVKGNVLFATDLARMIDPGNPTAWLLDEYMAFLIPRYYVPNPGGQQYSDTGAIAFPMCAVVRYLLANGRGTVADILSKVVGNGCRGDERLALYRGLSPSPYTDTDPRQVREMLHCFSQASWLDWDGHVGNPMGLILGAAPTAMQSYLLSVATPISGSRLRDKNDEVLRLGSVVPSVSTAAIGVPSAGTSNTAGVPPPPLPDDGFSGEEDIAFTEGKKVRIQHLRTERSDKLKRAFVEANGTPTRCEICGRKPLHSYPWLGKPNLQLHHKLPLSSSVHDLTTSVSDLVAICGACHSAVHAYYLGFLTRAGQEDFIDKAQAHTAYDEAKRKYVP